MNKKGKVIIASIIIILISLNIASWFYYRSQIDNIQTEANEAYAFIVDQNEKIRSIEADYDSLQKRNEELIHNKEDLEEKNQSLATTYQNLTVMYKSLQSDSENLQDRIDDLVNEYGYVFDYDPVTFEEYQIYIKELEDRVEKLGGFDIFETPKRKKIYDNITIWLEDGSNEKWADQVVEYLNKLPRKIVKTLKDDGWKIIITPRNMDEVYSSNIQNTVGLTFYYKGRIYLQNNTFSIGFATLHEVGHALDYTNDFMSLTNTWDDIYREEAEASEMGTYFEGSASEYFAQSFQYYFLEPEALKLNAPKSYEFMMEFINRYK